MKSSNPLHRDTEAIMPASGEGLLDRFMAVEEQKDEDGKTSRQVVQVRHRGLLLVDEVLVLDAVNNRTANTLRGYLNTGWAGKTMYQQRADGYKTRIVRSPQLGAIICAQTGHTGAIVDDRTSGFAARILPIYTRNWHWPTHQRPTEKPAQIVHPACQQHTLIQYDRTILADLNTYHRGRADNTPDPIPPHWAAISNLGWHIGWQALRVAAGIALLGRDTINQPNLTVHPDDWARAHMLLQYASASRTYIEWQNELIRHRELERMGSEQGTTHLARNRTLIARGPARIQARILTYTTTSWQPTSTILNRFAHTERPEAREQLPTLIHQGLLQTQPNPTGRGHQIRVTPQNLNGDHPS